MKRVLRSSRQPIAVLAVIAVTFMSTGSANSETSVPTGWDPDIWSSLTPSEQTLELEQSPDPNVTSAEKLDSIREHPWSDIESELVQELDAAPPPETATGITLEYSQEDPSIQVSNMWADYSPDHAVMRQVWAGSDRGDLTQGLVIITGRALESGATIPAYERRVFPGEGAMMIEDVASDVLTLAGKSTRFLLNFVTRDIDTVPDCSSVVATSPILWPPTRGYRLVTLSGATDADADPLTYAITAVTQDEPVSGMDPLDLSPDGLLLSGGQIKLRAELDPTRDGRVYRVAYVVSDGRGGSCTGTVPVSVPLVPPPGPSAVDSAPPSYNSLG